MSVAFVLLAASPAQASEPNCDSLTILGYDKGDEKLYYLWTGSASGEPSLFFVGSKSSKPVFAKSWAYKAGQDLNRYENRFYERLEKLTKRLTRIRTVAKSNWSLRKTTVREFKYTEPSWNDDESITGQVLRISLKPKGGASTSVEVGAFSSATEIVRAFTVPGTTVQGVIFGYAGEFVYPDNPQCEKFVVARQPPQAE